MKTGDIVKVIDGSWSMVLIKSVLRCSDSNLRNRRFQILAANGIYPTDKCQNRDGREVNNVLLSDVNDPDFVLFTQERFCRVTPPVPVVTIGEEVREILISRNVKRVVLTLP